MKFLKYFIVLFVLTSLGACTTVKPLVQKADVPCSDDGIISFTFLQLNDVYEIAPLEGGKVGGLARVAQIRNQLMSENPNTLTFMAGDFLNPSLLGTMRQNGERIRGREVVRPCRPFDPRCGCRHFGRSCHCC